MQNNIFASPKPCGGWVCTCMQTLVWEKLLGFPGVRVRFSRTTNLGHAILKINEQKSKRFGVIHLRVYTK